MADAIKKTVDMSKMMRISGEHNYVTVDRIKA
jgi:hypothetical protein